MTKATQAPACGYSADTEILTRHQGWVTFDQITCFDEVATRSPAGRFEWQYPEQVSWERYAGEMVWLHSRTLDLQVLPQHKIVHMERVRYMRGGQRHEDPPVERVSAAAAVPIATSLVATSRWEPVRPKSEFSLTPDHALSRLGRPPLRFKASAEDFAAFLGMYLAEGHRGPDRSARYDIWIWQKDQGRGYTEYQDLIDRVTGRHVPHIAKDGCWHFQNKALHAYLKRCGQYAWGKLIPAEVLNLPQGSLEMFWRYYNLGDGTTMDTGRGRKPLDSVSTTSSVMAGQLQEVLQKLGGWGLLQCIDFSKYKSRLGLSSHLSYRLNRRAGIVACATKIERVPYNGMIGNVQVCGRPVYVRRNYRPVWAGG
jgi:hypothetical protein